MGLSYWDELPAPWGRVTFSVDRDGRLLAVDLAGKTPEGVRDERRCAAVRGALEDYLAGRREQFSLPLALTGTPFQQRVWNALRAIPYGRVVSYADIARRIGQPGAARAVGQANGRNPIPIVVPCHRVVASGGGLGGFSNGLEIKRQLLAIEGHAR